VTKAALLLLVALASCANGMDRWVLLIGGVERSVLLSAPARVDAGRALPVVLVFHGGGGDGAGAARLTRFAALAERDTFLAVFPDGLHRNWNDGRDPSVSRTHREGIDDVAFIDALLDTIGRAFRIDSSRVFATGISNGGIFSHYLGARRSRRIAAIAPVAGGIAVPFDRIFHPAEPVAVLILQGTNDPLVPYEGGGIAWGRRGSIIGTPQAVVKWVTRNDCDRSPLREDLPDLDPEDGCRVSVYRWMRGEQATEVILYRIRGGGHTWPGGAQVLPASIVGPVCRDIDATDVIWKFFKAHPRR
jgi:polyhydroxybutyrate depolymerase